ncbi:MAG: 50S ribosomal protein L21 [Bacteroidales bacterium]|nr:50S ribosomal protein L21 [Bacteroidales bacterium]
MYAIIDVAGQQFKVEKGQKIFVHRLDEEEGKKIDFDKVLLIDNDGKITIGEPVINNAFVEGQVLEHKKGDKVIVFKKKRRKGYKVKNGHRQVFSHIEILSINEKGASAKSKEKPAAETKAAPKAKATAIKSETKKAVAKKPATKATAVKSEAKKPAAKKPAAKKPAAKKATATKATTTAKKPAAKKATTTKTKAAPKAAKPKATTKKDASKGDAK